MQDMALQKLEYYTTKASSLSATSREPDTYPTPLPTKGKDAATDEPCHQNDKFLLFLKSTQ